MSNTTTQTAAMPTPSKLRKMAANGELTELHTSLCRGYVSRKSEGVVDKYVGKFGQGFTLRSPNFESTRYCHITYFVR